MRIPEPWPLAALVFASDPSAPRFVDVAPAAGLSARSVIGGDKTKQYILETTGGGVAILDYDDDGWPDIFSRERTNASATPRGREPALPEQRRRHLRRRHREGGPGPAGLGQGVCVGDYDNDGHPDLLVTYYGRTPSIATGATAPSRT